MILSPYRELEKAIGYRFGRKRRLEEALCHRSFRHETEDVEVDNQRREFLGDAVLGLVVAHHLYDENPDLAEGDMTKARSRLTNAKTLAGIAQEIGLGKHLRLGRGEKREDGSVRESILADALEAVIGAAFVDGGLRAAQKIFRKLFLRLADAAEPDATSDNPKGELQEWAQQERKANPHYVVIAQSGPAHAMQFVVEVRLLDQMLARGEGSSKRLAETGAALAALQAIRTGTLQIPPPT